MKTKAEKVNAARKTAEANKAAKKAERTAKANNQTMVTGNTKKGKSNIPQSKTKK